MDTPLLTLRDCTVLRDGRPILHVPDLVIGAGEHVALLGPNGAGKSTFVRLLTRDVRPLAHDDGSPAVTLLGRERWDLFEARRIMGVVSDTLGDEYAVGVTVADCVVSGHFGSIGLYRHQRVTEAMRLRAHETMELLGIAHLAARRMDGLSTGEARRALIARALVHDPAVLVLDEPCAGLDPAAAWQVRGTFSRIAAAGHALLLVTHHIEDIGPETGRVVMLANGTVVADLPTAEALTDARLGALFGFPAHVEHRDGRYHLW